MKGAGITVSTVIWWIGCGLIFVGALLPWAKLGIFEKNGTEGDGVITLILALIGAGLALIWTRSRWLAIVGVLVAAIVVFVGIYDMADVASGKTEFLGEEIGPDIGEGLYLTVAGGLVALGASISNSISAWKRAP